MSVGQRLRQIRRARGMSLEDLSVAMNGAVSKQALSKYEKDRAMPRPTVLIALATALGVKSAELIRVPELHLEPVAYRALKSLPKRERARIESRVTFELEHRLRLQVRLGRRPSLGVGPGTHRVSVLEDAEVAAATVRRDWSLGLGPISNLTDAIEEHGVHVVEIESDKKFDGLAVLARDEDGVVQAAAIATRPDTSGQRQRLNRAHELGHLTLALGEDVDAEKAAFRFAGALLFPAEALFREVGEKRANISPAELLALKRRWGMSAQAILFRMRDLEVINQSTYTRWCVDISRLGWRSQEPGDSPPERATWLEVSALRAASEGLIAREEVAEYSPSLAACDSGASMSRRDLMRLPLSERRAIMRQQAEDAAEDYNATIDHEWLDGDFSDLD
jgi:Zn-dependent peptidase ImmA (M78 family)/transcriptional regulator with XRE-family HTH domain